MINDTFRLAAARFKRSVTKLSGKALIKRAKKANHDGAVKMCRRFLDGSKQSVKKSKVLEDLKLSTSTTIWCNANFEIVHYPDVRSVDIDRLRMDFFNSSASVALPILNVWDL